MGILLADNFSYQGRKPLDTRIIYDTISDMVVTAESTIYDGIMAYNKETEKFYVFKSTNTIDALFGKWRELSAESSGINVKEWNEDKTYNQYDIINRAGQDIGIVIASSITVPDNLSSSMLRAEWRNHVIANEIRILSESEIVTFYRGAEYYNNQIVRDQLTDNLYLALSDFEADDNITDYADNLQDCIDKGYLKLLGGSDKDASLTETITSNVLVGAAAAGSLFQKDMTFTQFAKKILLKDIIPTINFTASGSGLYEKGNSVNGSTLTLTITNLTQVTLPIDEIRFKIDSTVLDTQTFVAGQSVYTFIYSTVIDTNTTITAELIYDTNKPISKSAGFEFVNAAYYGLVNGLTVTAADITALAKNVKKTKGFTWNNITMVNQRFCYAYPAGQGNLTSIKDANNFEYIGSYTKTNLVINSENYNVYVLTSPSSVTGAKQIYA